MKRAALVACLLVVAGAALLATGGVLDLGFNPPTGMATKMFFLEGSTSRATGVAVDSLNRVVVAGSTAPARGRYDVGVIRYNPDGTLDTTFNGGGNAHDIYRGDEDVVGVVVDAQDRILIGGTTDGDPACNSCRGKWNFFVLRYNVNGTLDTTYGDGGHRLIDFDSDSDFAADMALDKFGRVVIVGGTMRQNENVAIARLTPEGDLDPAFDDDGKVVLSLANTTAFSSRATVVTIDSVDRLVVAVRLGEVLDFVYRFWDTGDRDTDFGRTSLSDGSWECQANRIAALAVDAFDRVLMTGNCDYAQDMLVMRVNEGGTLDSSFGNNAAVRVKLSGASVKDLPRGIGVDLSGRIIVGGVGVQCGVDMFLARFDSVGALDPTFGTSQGVTFAGINTPTCTYDEASAFAFDRNMNMLLVGSTIDQSTNTTKFLTARFRREYPDYEFSPVPQLDVLPGGTGATTVTVNSIDGFNELLKVAPYGGVPDGFSWSFEGYGAVWQPFVPAFGSSSVTLQVSVTALVTPGIYTLSMFDAREPTNIAYVNVNVTTSLPFIQAQISEFEVAGYIDSPGTMTSMRTMLDKAESSVAQGNAAAAIRQLNALKNYIAAQAGKHIATTATKDGTTFNPAALLTSSVDTMIHHLSF